MSAAGRDPPDDGDDDVDRDAILQRRQRLIAIAIAGLASASGCDLIGPQTCLSPTVQPETPPQPCLSQSTIERDEEPRPGLQPADPDDPGTPQACLARGTAVEEAAPVEEPTALETGGRPGRPVRPMIPGRPQPQPCLSAVPDMDDEPSPQPCLSQAHPKGGDPDRST